MTLFETLERKIRDEVPCALATVVSGPEHVGSKLLVDLDGKVSQSDLPDILKSPVREDAQRLLSQGKSQTLTYDLPHGEYAVFIDVYPVLPQLVVIGATDTAIHLSSFGKALGYRVIVTDARAAFARRERFPSAERVLKGWPQDVLPTLRLDESTYAVLLSHDPKFDEPTLDILLPSPVRYIGAIGSRSTQEQRFARLRAAGYTEEQLNRVHGPIGLDLGGRSPEETALAILAEITAVRYGRSGSFMRRTKPAAAKALS